MDRESFGVDGFDLGSLQGQTRIAKVKSAYNSLITGIRLRYISCSRTEFHCSFNNVFLFQRSPI